MNEMTFDSVLHLAGEQALPVYIGIQQCKCKHHIIAVSAKTRRVGETIQKKASREGLHVELLDVPAYDTAQATALFKNEIIKHPGCAFNLTGGTKPMFAAGYQAGFAADIPMFYVETAGQALYWIGRQPGKTPLVSCMDSVQSFIELSGFQFKKNTMQSAGSNDELLDTCWKNKEALGRWYRKISEIKYPGIPFKIGPDIIEKITLSAHQEGPEKKYRGTIQINAYSKSAENWPDLVSFLSGGWFELFVARQVATLKQEKAILDYELNAIVEIEDDPATGRSYSLQELDLSFTDGFYLTILECKAGAVNQDHVQKLENLSRSLGGHFGRGVLVSAFELDQATKRRISTSSTVSAISQHAITDNPKHLIHIKPGEILGSKLPSKKSTRSSY